jgi:hypothetical protein
LRVQLLLSIAIYNYVVCLLILVLYDCRTFIHFSYWLLFMEMSRFTLSYVLLLLGYVMVLLFTCWLSCGS